MKNYFYTLFPHHLQQFVYNGLQHKQGMRYSDFYGLYFGGPEWNYFQENLRVIPPQNRADFILSLFMIIFADQSLHAYNRELYDIWHTQTNFPHFGHAGFGAHNRNPFFILATVEKYDKDLYEQILLKIPEFVIFLIDEMVVYFQKLFQDKIDLKDYFRFVMHDPAYTLIGPISQGAEPELENNRARKLFCEGFVAHLKTLNFDMMQEDTKD